MCGRYYVDDETTKEIEKIVREMDAALLSQQKKGDIYPTNLAPVLLAEAKGLEVACMYWGFPNFNRKGVIFNARSETVLEKRIFKESFTSRRCAVPANGFYEWDHSRNKLYFKHEQDCVIFFAGFYHIFEEKKQFVILTTNSNESMKDVHQRMPLILKRKELESWIFDRELSKSILHQVPPPLIREGEYIQESLFLTD